MDRIGHCSIAHHSASRQQERIDERHHRFGAYHSAQIRDPREVYVWGWFPPYEFGGCVWSELWCV